MAFQEMELSNRLLGNAQALAALAARLRLDQLGVEGDPATAVDDLFTVRSGGSVIDSEEALARLRRAGFGDTREVERDWDAPLRLVVGRRS